MQFRTMIAAFFCSTVPVLVGADPSLSSRIAEPARTEIVSGVLHLQDAIERTLKNNPNLYQYRLRQKTLAAERETSLLPPELEFGLEVENIAGTGEFSSFRSAETTLSLSSVIELGEKVSARTAVVEAKSNRLMFEQQAATLEVLGELTAAFIRTLASQELITLATEAESLASEMLEIVEQRAAKGAAPEVEVMRARAAVAQATIRLKSIRGRFERNKLSLSNYWGSITPSFARLDGSLTSFEPSDEFTTLFERASQSPSIAVFTEEENLQNAKIKLAQAQSRVDVGWQLGVRRLEETDDTALTASVSIPLFRRDRNRSVVTAAMVERDKLDYRREDTLLRLHNSLYTAFSQRQENLAIVEIYSNVVLPALQQSLGLTTAAYKSGRYRYQDWYLAQEELLDAKKQRIEAAAAAQLNQALIEQFTAASLPQNNS